MAAPDPPTGRDPRWIEDQKRRIREAFALFDKERKGCVIQDEVPTILRCLGIYPTERALVKEILPEMQGGDDMPIVLASRFEEKALELLASRHWEPDPEDVVLQALRTLDEEGEGYIEVVRLRELLTTKGTPFREKEMDAFLGVARDPDNMGRVYCEDYIAVLGES